MYDPPWSTRSPGSTARSHRVAAAAEARRRCCRRFAARDRASRGHRAGARGGAARRPRRPAPAELLAFVSLARLAAGTPTLADIGALAGGHLRHIAPGADGGAVRSRRRAQPAHRAVRVRAGAPPRSPGLTHPAAASGVTGWVGANLRAMPKADARLDLQDVHAGRRCGRRAATAARRRRRRWSACSRSTRPSRSATIRRAPSEMIAPQLALAAVASVKCRQPAETARTAAATRARSGMRVVARR